MTKNYQSISKYSVENLFSTEELIDITSKYGTTSYVFDEKNKGNLMLCTDIPDKPKEYFYEKKTKQDQSLIIFKHAKIPILCYRLLIYISK